MKTHIKKILFLFLLILIVAIIGLLGAGYYVLKNKNSLAQNFIEERASIALGTKVTLKALDLSLKERKLTLKNFEIENPEGFKKPFAVRFKNISITLGKISRDLVIVKDISVSGADVNYTAQSGGSNLTLIRKNVVQNRRLTTNDNTHKIKIPNVILNRFALEKVTVYPEMKLIAGQSLDTTVNLSNIVLNDIGLTEGGISPKAALDIVLQTLNSRVRTAVARAGFFEGLTSVGLLSITGGIPVIGVADELLGLVGLSSDEAEENEEKKETRKPIIKDGRKPRFNP